MFCSNCGKEIADNLQFCPNCGGKLSISETKEVKKSKKLLSPIIAGAIVLVSLIVVIIMIASSKGYEKEVKNYLDYFVEESKDVEDFLSVAYMGGEFGSCVNSTDAAEIHKLIFKTMFENIEDMGGMYYYNFASDYSDWEDYIEEGSIEYIYDEMDDLFDSWKFTYKIKDSKKLSKSKIDDLQDTLDDALDEYEDMANDMDFDSDDEEVIEKYIDKMSDKDIKTAYQVKVKISIDGDDASVDETYKFQVAKVGKDWIILDGPSMDDIIYDAD